MGLKIHYFDRYQQKNCEEMVYGGDWLKFIYQHPVGKALQKVIVSPVISKIYGALQDHSYSRNKIDEFIKKYSIDMSEYEEKNFQSFNDFFIRRFKSRKRTFSSDAKVMPAVAEGRYCGYAEVSDQVRFPVKGKYLNCSELLQNDHWAQQFQSGPLLIARLCPVDYHRFHFPDDCRILDQYRIEGSLYSVNPLALQAKADLFFLNERQVSILETQNFGRLAYIEVGATCVGKIVQSYQPKEGYLRGEEKGYFLFGGSTVIVLGEPGKWIPAQDILEKTQEETEVFIRLGDEMARAKD